MGKFKNFLKYNGIASIYLTFLILVQILCSYGILMYKIFTDFSFTDKFLEVMGPIYENGKSYFENYEDILVAYSDLISGIIIPILLFSNLMIVLIIGIKIIRNKEKDNLFHKISINNILKYVFLGVLLNIIISIVISFLPNNLVEEHSNLTSMVLTGNIFILIVCSGILAPIAEEFIFRYGIMKNLMKINIPFAIIYQALLFGLLHGNLVQSSYAFILGLIFGFIDYKKNNIWYSIILHISINTSSVLVSSMGTNETISFVILFIITLLLALLANLNNIIKKNQ